MVMIVKGHEKKAHGFISVTRSPLTPMSGRFWRHAGRVPVPASFPGAQPAAVEAARRAPWRTRMARMFAPLPQAGEQ
jgi:hypothetical protein